MPIKLYIYAATLILGIGIGTGITYKVMRSQVLSMELKIAEANTQALTELAIAKDKVNEAETKARLKNEELDNANAQSIQTINVYHDKLASAIRLRDPNNKDNSNTMSNCPNTIVNSENEKSGGYLSEELSRLLQSETDRADKITVDYNTLLEFVQGGCGIAK